MIKIVTGKINAGKTSTMQQLYLQTPQGDGFLALKIFDGNSVRGYDLLALSSQQTHPWMIEENYYAGEFIHPGNIGHFIFDLDYLATVEKALSKLIAAGVSPLYLDEIGPLELKGAGFDRIFRKMLASGLDLVITVRAEILTAVIEKYQITDYQIITVTAPPVVTYDTAIVGGRVYLDGHFREQNLYLQDGKIAMISPKLFPAQQVIDARGLEVLPGVIDPHVHFDLDLGHIHSVDDFYYGSVSAAYGGVTSIIDFLDPASNAEELAAAYQKSLALAQASIVDFHFHATIKKPTGSLEEFVLMMKKLGMYTVKLFTTYADSGRNLEDQDIIELLTLAKQHHILVLAHIENDELITLNDQFTYLDLPRSRPSVSESSKALALAGFVAQTDSKLYMVHCSSGATLEQLVSQYPTLINTRFFVESCPQYFTFTSADFTRPDGYLYTCAPPLRSQKEQQLLFTHAAHIDTIGTDHCAFNRADKMQPYLKSMPLGIGGIEHSFVMMRKLLGEQAIDKMSARVASLMGLPTKGRIAIGYDADVLFYRPENNAIIDTNHGRADYSLYRGIKVPGRVISTMVRGKFILQNQKLIGGKGRLIPAKEIL